jgi:hypothetical protein
MKLFKKQVHQGSQPAQPSPAQAQPAQPSPAQPSPAQAQTAQPSPAQPSPAQAQPLKAQGYLTTVFVLDGLIAVGAPFFDVWYGRYAFKTPAPDIPLQGGAALIAVVTFVGIWLIQRSRPSVDSLSEMRDAIAAAVVVVYLVILAWSSFFPQISKSSNEELNPLTSTFITNFTALTGVVIGFYFTSTAATQIAANKSKQSAQNGAANSTDTKVT